MIFAYNATYYLYFKRFTALPDKFSNSQCNIANKNLITILRYPNKMVFNVEH